MPSILPLVAPGAILEGDDCGGTEESVPMSRAGSTTLDIALEYNHAIEMGHWLKRHTRISYCKQRSSARRRTGELIKLGAPRYQAIPTGLGMKGYWHLA
jgi:hypothetical protein